MIPLTSATIYIYIYFNNVQTDMFNTVNTPINPIIKEIQRHHPSLGKRWAGAGIYGRNLKDFTLSRFCSVKVPL